MGGENGFCIHHIQLNSLKQGYGQPLPFLYEIPNMSLDVLNATLVGPQLLLFFEI